MITINDAEVLSIDHRYDFWGNTLNYRNVQTISLNGRVLSNNESGVLGTWEQISGKFFDDWNNIVVNDVNLGPGRLTSISLPEGLDVKQKGYTITFEVYKTGNLSSLNQQYFSGLSFNTGDLVYIDNIQESFDFSRETDGVYQHQRDLSFGVLKDTTGDTVAIAKSFANSVFNDTPSMQLLTAQYPDFYQASGVKYYQETYDILNHTYGFQESFRFDPSSNYIWTYQNSLELDENGVVTVNEEGNIVGTASGAYEAASGAFDTISGGIYNRISGVLSSYSGAFGVLPCVLKNQPTTKNVVADTCVGTISYNFQYSNDPAITESGYSWVYSQQIERDTTNGLYTVTENGTVIGYSDNRKQAFLIAKSGYDNEIQAGIKPRALQTLSGVGNLLLNGTCSGQSSDLAITSKTLELSEFNGEVSYTNTYTNDSTLLDSDNAFTSVVVTSGDVNPVHLTNTFGIVNNKEIIQPTNSAILGDFEWNVELRGKNWTTLDEYLSKAFSLIKKPINLNVLEGQTNEDTYISDFGYTFDPIEKLFNLNLTYSYNKYRKFKDILVW